MLALAAAAGLIVLSVHGIFLHSDEAGNEPHACTLCEINHFEYTFPETIRFTAETLAPAVSPPYREIEIHLPSQHRLGLRGPPFFTAS